MNPRYAKALVKRGEVNLAAGEVDDAVSDFAAAKALTDDFGVEGKLKQAQQQQKKDKKRDYYKDLGVEKTATEKEIKTAYRKAALKWHPDRNSETEETKKKAEKMMQRINEANDILSDPEKRKKHDMGMSGEDINSGHPGNPFGGMGGGMPGGMGGMEDILKMFMGMQGGGMGGMGGMGGGRGRGGMGGMPPGFSFDMSDMGGMGGMPGMGRGGGRGQGGNPFGFQM